MDTLTQAQLNRTLLQRQRLLEPSQESAVELIRHLGAVQAQEGPAPYFALAARLRAFAKADLDKLRQEHAVVRATVHRRTIHLLATEDYLAWQPFYQERVEKDLAKRGFPLLPVDEWLPKVRQELGTEAVSKSQVKEAVEKFTTPAFYDQSSQFTLMSALGLVRVPGEKGEALGGKEQWQVADAVVGSPVAGSKAAMVRRYLRAFGPATPGDFTAWAGLPGAKAIFDSMKDELWTGKDESGRLLYDLEDEPRLAGTEVAPEALLLGDFDNLILSHQDRSRIIADAHRRRMNKNLLAMAPMVVRGEFAGVWVRRRPSSQAAVEFLPYGPVTQKQKKTFEAIAEQTAHFWTSATAVPFTWVEP